MDVEAEERSDGRGGPVTSGEPTIRVYGSDFDGVDVTRGTARALAADLAEATAVLERLGVSTCPSWCIEDHVDDVAGSLSHWTDRPLPHDEDIAGPPSARIQAHAVQDMGRPLSAVTSSIHSAATT